MKNLDESHVALRQCRRLQRRQYISPGPDHMWHIDGYDKLKPYGFAIHGAIDGFGRKIIWLNVSLSNNNPAYISYYFIQTTELGRVPQVICGDKRFRKYDDLWYRTVFKKKISVAAFWVMIVFAMHHQLRIANRGVVVSV